MQEFSFRGLTRSGMTSNVMYGFTGWKGGINTSSDWKFDVSSCECNLWPQLLLEVWKNVNRTTQSPDLDPIQHRWDELGQVQATILLHQHPWPRCLRWILRLDVHVLLAVQCMFISLHTFTSRAWVFTFGHLIYAVMDCMAAAVRHGPSVIILMWDSIDPFRGNSISKVRVSHTPTDGPFVCEVQSTSTLGFGRVLTDWLLLPCVCFIVQAAHLPPWECSQLDWSAFSPTEVPCCCWLKQPL